MNDCAWWIRRGTRGVGLTCVLLMLASTSVRAQTAITGESNAN